MATKLIPDLSATSSPLADGDLVVIEKADGTGTKKMTFAQLCQAVATKNYVNNATTTASYKALDARMGKTLNDSISTVSTKVTNTIGFNATGGVRYFSASGDVTADNVDSVFSLCPISGHLYYVLTLPHVSIETGNRKQVAWKYASDDPTTYVRYYNGSTWSEWKTESPQISLIKYSATTTKLTVNSGYTTISYPSGYTAQDTYVVLPKYLTGCLAGWSYTVQQATSINIYVRVGASNPTDGSTIALDLLAIKNI